MPTVKLEHAPENGVFYPEDLLGSPDIHHFVPHLPVLRRNPESGKGNYFSIPFGDYESHIDARIALFVKKVTNDSFSLVLDPDQEEYFPLSINHGQLLRAPIAELAVVQNKIVRPVYAYDAKGENIELGMWQSQSLKGFMIGAVNSAIRKTLLHRYQKTVA